MESLDEPDPLDVYQQFVLFILLAGEVDYLPGVEKDNPETTTGGW